MPCRCTVRHFSSYQRCEFRTNPYFGEYGSATFEEIITLSEIEVHLPAPVLEIPVPRKYMRRSFANIFRYISRKIHFEPFSLLTDINIK